MLHCIHFSKELLSLTLLRPTMIYLLLMGVLMPIQNKKLRMIMGIGCLARTKS